MWFVLGTLLLSSVLSFFLSFWLLSKRHKVWAFVIWLVAVACLVGSILTLNKMTAGLPNPSFWIPS